MGERGIGLIAWLVVLGLISALLALMTDLSHLSAKKNIGDQLPATRDAIQRNLITYGQNPQALYQSIQHPGDAAGNQNLSACLSGNCPPQNQGVGQPFSLYDSAGNGPVAGPSPTPIYYSTNGQLSPNGLASPSPGPLYPLQTFASLDILCIPNCSFLQVQLTTSVSMPNELKAGPGLGRLSAISGRSSTVNGSAIGAGASPSPSSSPSSSPSPSPSSSCTAPISEQCSSGCVNGLDQTGSDQPAGIQCPFNNGANGYLWVCCPPNNGIVPDPPTHDVVCCPNVGQSPSPSPSASPSPSFFGCAIAMPTTWGGGHCNGINGSGQLYCKAAGQNPTYLQQGQCMTFAGQGFGTCAANGSIQACCTVGVSNPCNPNAGMTCPSPGSTIFQVTWSNAQCTPGGFN